ncbi:MAG TPA: diacylglycerol kinase family lipid kinase [Firmicutes bacterium]|jgi:diacylglycerol kinase (ATP)|nr:diacylglycerol kinase family lipid kinase [Bacillota bacterium]
MSLAIIANPAAGRGRGQRVAHLVEDMLKDRAVDFEILYTKKHRHGIELAEKASRNHEIVAAIGGDGTIGEVLEGILHSNSILGIIPGGTGNDYSRGLGLPRQTEAALDVILGGNPTRIDVGVETDKVFGVLASIGFPVTVIEHTNEHRDGPLTGSLAILASVAYTLRNLRTYPVEITLDNQVIVEDVVGIMVMNMPYGGGGLKFAPDARYDDGHFTVVIIGRVGKLELATTLPKVYSGGHVGHPKVTMIRAQRVKIECEPLPKMFDGDLCSATPFNAHIRPQAARVMMPKKP